MGLLREDEVAVFALVLADRGFKAEDDDVIMNRGVVLRSYLINQTLFD